MSEPEVPHAVDGRRETTVERMDRNWTDLVQELRVAETGVQILTGFLLTVPFQQRFDELSRTEHVVYLVAVTFSVTATVLLVAPVSYHRMLFRRHEKDRLVSAADRLAKAGLTSLALAVCTVTLLVFDVVVGAQTAIVATTVAAVLFLALWVVVPLVARRR